LRIVARSINLRRHDDDLGLVHAAGWRLDLHLMAEGAFV
jgi:hypothetical protein